MASTIGIKIANGEFYSIVDENSPVKKRLVLTTVHDDQQSVQIDLYRSYTRTMADALYIGSLVVENIKPRLKGEPSIELVLSSSKNGDISADAVDMDPSGHGEHHSLNVSLKSLDEDNREYELPDFELEHNESPPTGLFEKAVKVRKEEKKEFPWLIIACAALLIAAIALMIWLFLFRDRGGSASRPPAAAPATAQPAAPPPAAPQPAAPPPAAPQPAAPQPAAPQPAATPPPVIQAPAAPASSVSTPRVRPTPPVASYRVPSVIPREGAPYRVRWGDTLWDIAAAFYRNPWLYPRIARFNNIRNPDHIISGTTIRVPPRN